jgi:lysophospholipase L1-like esterase
MPASDIQAKNPKWQATMDRFAARDAETSPPENAILFTGSSSIVGWKVDKFFPDMPVLNRGFGGSKYSDLVDYFDQVIVPYRPKTVVLYSGDNDLAGGETTTTVVKNMKQVVELIQERFPETRVILIPPKASIARWELFPLMREVGEVMQQMADEDSRVIYVDTSAPMLGPNGKPRPELYVGDKLHMTEEAYVLWSDLVRPHLQK